MECKRVVWVLGSIAAVLVGFSIPRIGRYFASEVKPVPKVASLVVSNGGGFDFGTVDEGKQINHDFQIANRSDHDIHITSVMPGCGCTNAQLDKNTIPPKGVVTLKTKYTARPRTDRESIDVVMVTDEAAQPYLRVNLTGFIQPKVMAYPAGLNFYGRFGETLSDRHFTLWSNGKLELTSPLTSSSHITATWKETDGKYMCIVRVASDCPVGNWNEWINVELDTPLGKKELELPVSVMILDSELPGETKAILRK